MIESLSGWTSSYCLPGILGPPDDSKAVLPTGRTAGELPSTGLGKCVSVEPGATKSVTGKLHQKRNLLRNYRSFPGDLSQDRKVIEGKTEVMT